MLCDQLTTLRSILHASLQKVKDTCQFFLLLKKKKKKEKNDLNFLPCDLSLEDITGKPYAKLRLVSILPRSIALLAAFLTFKKQPTESSVLLTIAFQDSPTWISHHPWSTPALGRVNFARRIDFDPGRGYSPSVLVARSCINSLPS